MAADDPGIVALIVAVKGLGPVMVRALRSPERGRGMIECVRIARQDLGDIKWAVAVGSLAARVVVPQEVEDPHVPVSAGASHRPIGGRRQVTSQGVGGRPRQTRVG